MSTIKDIDTILRSDITIGTFKQTNAYKLSYNNEYIYFMESLKSSPQLQSCSIQSLIASFKNISVTGLTLSPLLRQSFLKSVKVQSTYKCFLEPTYQGMITKMIELGGCLDIYAMVHYKNDEFECNFGSEVEITKHVPYYIQGWTESGIEVGAYAVAVLKNKVKKLEYIPASKFQEVAMLSDSYKADLKNNTKFSAWSNSFRPDMIKKTAIKHLWNYIPKHSNLEIISRIFELDNEAQQYNLNGTVETESGIKFKIKDTVKTKDNREIM